MSQQDELSEPDLIDRIANALPAEVRADYYREMRHCRSLPENDEMLRILRAMQFSGLCSWWRCPRAWRRSASDSNRSSPMRSKLSRMCAIQPKRIRRKSISDLSQSRRTSRKA